MHGKQLPRLREGQEPLPAGWGRQAKERSSSVDPDLRTRLLFPIMRLERSRNEVLRILDSLGYRAAELSRAVDEFRARWEVLDLEFHALMGRPLTLRHYQRHLAPARSPNASPLTRREQS